MRGLPEIDSARNMESRRHDANNRRRLSPKRYLLADCPRIAVEVPLPGGIAQHNGIGKMRFIILLIVGAPQQRLYAKHAPESSICPRSFQCHRQIRSGNQRFIVEVEKPEAFK